ncbi:MAG TPA: cytochrome c3 family protein [Candidatus Limnocylindria bacterium]|nr:cytochrome c3 family protein [Candidatus Limnocylindria bacterium]
MPLNRGTQKQIAQRFKGNLDYFRKPHYWRKLRFLTILIVCLAGSAVMAWFFFRGSAQMYNPGPISQHHARFASDCSQCHEPLRKSLAGATLKLSNEGIDQRCENCHVRHSFHQPNVVHDRSCTACHQEHQGSGPMAALGDSQCVRCHGDAHEMATSAEKGKTLSAAAFDYRPDVGWKTFKAPRPADGFTAAFTSFAKDHPEFRLIADKLRETNTLKFNHRRHLADTNDIPLVSGRPIDCAFCHQPGPGGAFFQKISYEQNCRVCHGLQFDDTAPTLTLPHGRAEHVRAFLRSLPTHYAELARADANKTSTDVDEFVTKQMLRLREQFVDGTNLEREIFFTDLRKSPDGRTKFDGCATCHEVKLNSAAAPVITQPTMPDRWMMRARFDHSKHTSVACVKCHHATRSADTADIIMPAKSSCVECHSPQERVASNCSFCHSYHPQTSKDGFGTQELRSSR